MKRIVILVTFVMLFSLAMSSLVAAQDGGAVEVMAVAETTPAREDGATSPVIWIHPTDTSLSVVVGSDDNGGVGVYDLTGAELQYLEAGEMGGMDLRYNFPFNGEGVTLIAGAVKDRPRVLFFTVNPETRELSQIGELEVGIPVGGLCLYHSAISGDFFAIPNSDDGDVEQWQISDDGSGAISGELVRSFGVGSETEGCAVDDEMGRFYIGEQEVAIWNYSAEPDGGTDRTVVDTVGAGGNITEEVEGLAMIFGSDGAGYIIASNEKESNFLVYERQGENRFVGKFAVIDGEMVDGIEEAPALGVTNYPLGEAFPQGLFVAADDSNGSENTNFKLVSWGTVAEALGLSIDTEYDPRSMGMMAE